MGALLSLFSTGTELAQLIPSYVPQASSWVAVRQRFAQLNQNTNLTLLQKVDGRTKLSGVLNCLNQSYYDLPSGEANSLLMLQEVRSVLAPTYPNTTIQADRHVVLISFGSYAVEVAPVFLLTDRSYWICDTTGTGHYKVANPIAEAAYIHQVDLACNGILLATNHPQPLSVARCPEVINRKGGARNPVDNHALLNHATTASGGGMFSEGPIRLRSARLARNSANIQHAPMLLPSCHTQLHVSSVSHLLWHISSQEFQNGTTA